MDSHQANLQLYFFLLNSFLCFNLTPHFLDVTFDRTFSLFKHVSLPKAKFFPRLKALRCISASSWGPSLFCTKLFFGLFSLMPYPNVSFSCVNNLPNWKAFTERPVAPSPAVSRPPLFHFFSLRPLYESPCLISPFLLISGFYVFELRFSF